MRKVKKTKNHRKSKEKIESVYTPTTHPRGEMCGLALSSQLYF